MLTLRVEGRGPQVARLEKPGLAVERRAERGGHGSYGRLARIVDPDGSHVELREPPQSRD